MKILCRYYMYVHCVFDDLCKNSILVNTSIVSIKNFLLEI